MVNTTQQIGGTMGTAVFSSVYATAVSTYLVSSHDNAAATVYGYTTAFGAAAGVFFVGAFIAATVYTGRRTSPVQRGATAVAS
jgi:hypothetical protein